MWGPTIVGFGSYHYKYASGREGDAARRGIALPAARVLVVVAAEAHNRRTPHLRRFARYSGHQRQQAERVSAPDRMLDGGQELLHRRAGCLRYVFSHEGSLAERGTPVRGGGCPGINPFARRF